MNRKQNAPSILWVRRLRKIGLAVSFFVSAICDGFRGIFGQKMAAGDERFFGRVFVSD